MGCPELTIHDYFRACGKGAAPHRQVHIKTGDAGIYFYYDGLLRRYAISDENGLRYFVWDSNGVNLLAETDSSGAATAKYAHGATPIEGIGSMVQAERMVGEASYYQYPAYDHRGSVYKLTDDSGDTIASYEYNAWGVSSCI